MTPAIPEAPDLATTYAASAYTAVTCTSDGALGTSGGLTGATLQVFQKAGQFGGNYPSGIGGGQPLLLPFVAIP